jgi:hypothetical protein
MKSLSELQSSPDVGLPEAHADVCVAAKLVDELSAIDAELFEVEAEVEVLREREASKAEGDPQGPPARPGDVSPLLEKEAKATELAAKADEVRDRIADHNVRLQLRAKPGGEWRQWAVANPARDEDADPQGAARDARWAGGHVNIDALAADLHQFVTRYNDEEPSDAWAAFVRTKGAPAHLVLAASKVVGMHEQVVDEGKSRSAWLAARRSVNGSA